MKTKKEAATRDIRVRPSTHKKLQRMVRRYSLHQDRLVTIPEIVDALVELYESSMDEMGRSRKT